MISQGQENKTKEIRKRYYQIEENKEDFNVHKVELNYMLPACRSENESYQKRFYFDNEILIKYIYKKPGADTDKNINISKVEKFSKKELKI
ncbi:MAG: hypothetical protein L3J35_07665 [Bacteroidales bacterium]|nr:hypothetical protein [Bacteroidales bacterium]